MGSRTFPFNAPQPLTGSLSRRRYLLGSRIEGLTPETHAKYCRDALAIVLKECPEIQGLTLRVHGESGTPEGSYPFWKTLFEAIAGCGRTIEIDPGQPLSLTLRVTGEPAPIASVHLHYRHVDQAERWQSVPMEASQGNHKAEIPGDYTNSPYPLQYYFELRRGNAEAWLYPAFNSSLSNQPYYAITHS